MSNAPHSVAHEAHAEEHSHPSVATYVKVGAVLGLLTIVEIALPTTHVLGGLTNPALILFAAVKFGIVVAFYMHLKYDSRLFTYIFGFGLFIAVGVITALLFLFSQYPFPHPLEAVVRHWPPYARGLFPKGSERMPPEPIEETLWCWTPSPLGEGGGEGSGRDARSLFLERREGSLQLRSA